MLHSVKLVGKVGLYGCGTLLAFWSVGTSV